MGRPRMVKLPSWHNDTIKTLIKNKIIVGVRCKHGFLVARWGINKTTLVKESKKLAR